LANEFFKRFFCGYFRKITFVKANLLDKITFVKANLLDKITFVKVDDGGVIHFVMSPHSHYCRKIAVRLAIFAEDIKHEMP